MATEVAASAPVIDSVQPIESVEILKKKTKKKLKKPLTTASSQSTLNEVETNESPKEPEGPIVEPALETSERKNSYSDLVQKRLRTLRKRQAKLESYAALDVTELQRDQVEALAKLPEVKSLVRELEEVLKQMSVLEVDEARYERNLAKKREAEIMSRVKEARKESLTSLDELFKALYQWNVLYEQSKPELDEHVSTALLYLRGLVSGAGLQPLETMDVFVENARHHWNMFVNESSDEFMGSTYKELFKLTQTFVGAPEQAANTAEDSENPEKFDSAVIAATEAKVDAASSPYATNAASSQANGISVNQPLWLQNSNGTPVSTALEAQEYVEIPPSGIKFGSVVHSEAREFEVAVADPEVAASDQKTPESIVESSDLPEEGTPVKSAWHMKTASPAAPVNAQAEHSSVTALNVAKAGTVETAGTGKGPRSQAGSNVKNSRYRKHRVSQQRENGVASGPAGETGGGFQQIQRRGSKVGENGQRPGRRDAAGANPKPSGFRSRGGSRNVAINASKTSSASASAAKE